MTSTPHSVQPSLEDAPVHGSLRTGHFPPIDAAQHWSATFFAFLDSVQ